MHSMSGGPIPYSRNNPYQYEPKINALVEDINSGKTGAEKVNSLVGLLLDGADPKIMTTTLKGKFAAIPREEALRQEVPNFMDEVVGQIKDASIQMELRKVLDLINEGDIVCRTGDSQGKFPDGRAACSCICFHAAEQLMNGPPISGEEEIHALMNKGVETYRDLRAHEVGLFQTRAEKEKRVVDIPIFSEIFPIVSERERVQNMAIVVPKGMEFIRDIDFYEANPGIAITAKTANDFPAVLNALDRLAEEKDQRACAAITCNGETVVVSYPEPGKPALFDSHGRTYKGMNKGASFLKFNSNQELAEHLSKKLFAKAEYFDVQFIESKVAGKPEKEKEPEIAMREKEPLGKGKEKEFPKENEPAMREKEPLGKGKEKEFPKENEPAIKEKEPLGKGKEKEFPKEKPVIREKEQEAPPTSPLTARNEYSVLHPVPEKEYSLIYSERADVLRQAAKEIIGFISLNVDPLNAIIAVSRNHKLTPAEALQIFNDYRRKQEGEQAPKQSRKEAWEFINKFAKTKEEGFIPEPFLNLIDAYYKSNERPPPNTVLERLKDTYKGLTPNQIIALQCLVEVPDK